LHALSGPRFAKGLVPHTDDDVHHHLDPDRSRSGTPPRSLESSGTAPLPTLTPPPYYIYWTGPGNHAQGPGAVVSGLDCAVAVVGGPSAGLLSPLSSE